MSDKDARAMRVVVLSGRPEHGAKLVAEAIAEALSRVAGEDERGGSIPPDAAPESSAESLLQRADAAVVLDPGSLERARAAGTTLCAAVLPSFDIAWGGDLAEADRIIVSHQLLVPSVVERGAPRDRVVVGGVVGPKGYVPPADRRALRAAAGLSADATVVLVPTATFEEEDATSLLVQLSLVRSGTVFLFDVERDVETAEMLRRRAPAHGLRSHMFSSGPHSHELWQLADVVVGRPRGWEISQALAVGAPVVVVPAGRMGVNAAATLEELGVARGADRVATLAVAIDAALEPAWLEVARSKIVALEIGGAAKRVAAAVRDAWERRLETASFAARGLPIGLERLGGDRRASTQRKTLPETPAARDDIEQRLDKELADLKKRL